VLDAKQEFEHVSFPAKSGVARFEKEWIRLDRGFILKQNLKRLLDDMLARKKETIQARDVFRQLLLKKALRQDQSAE
jgi:hypothetical protein